MPWWLIPAIEIGWKAGEAYYKRRKSMQRRKRLPLRSSGPRLEGKEEIAEEVEMATNAQVLEVIGGNPSEQQLRDIAQAYGLPYGGNRLEVLLRVGNHVQGLPGGDPSPYTIPAPAVALTKPPDPPVATQAPQAQVPAQPVVNQQPVQHTVTQQPVVSTWTCLNDQHVNLQSNEYCSRCGQPKPTNQVVWNCALGHRNTDMSANFCVTCGAPRLVGGQPVAQVIARQQPQQNPVSKAWDWLKIDKNR